VDNRGGAGCDGATRSGFFLNNISAEISAVLVVKTFPSETASEVILGWVA